MKKYRLDIQVWFNSNHNRIWAMVNGDVHHWWVGMLAEKQQAQLTGNLERFLRLLSSSEEGRPSPRSPVRNSSAHSVQHIPAGWKTYRFSLLSLNGYRKQSLLSLAMLSFFAYYEDMIRRYNLICLLKSHSRKDNRLHHPALTLLLKSYISCIWVSVYYLPLH